MSYQEISDTQLAAGSPVTQQLMQQLVDNPIASSEGHETAPAQKLKEFTYPESDSASIEDLYYYLDTVSVNSTPSYTKLIYLEVQRNGRYGLFTGFNRSYGNTSIAEGRWQRIRSGTTTTLATYNHNGASSTEIEIEDFLVGDIIYFEARVTQQISQSGVTVIQIVIGSAFVMRTGTTIDLQNGGTYANQQLTFTYASTTTSPVVRYGFNFIGK